MSLLGRRSADIAEAVEQPLAGVAKAAGIVWHEDLNERFVQRSSDRVQRRPDGAFLVDELVERRGSHHPVEPVGQHKRLVSGELDREVVIRHRRSVLAAGLVTAWRGSAISDQMGAANVVDSSMLWAVSRNSWTPSLSTAGLTRSASQRFTDHPRGR
jgi:hypothetical protein